MPSGKTNKTGAQAGAGPKKQLSGYQKRKLAKERALRAGTADEVRGAPTVEDFARLFNGPTIFAAIQAIIGAVADFTQPPATAAEFNRGLPAAWERMDRAAAAKVKTALSGLSVSAGDSPESAAVAPLG